MTSLAPPARQPRPLPADHPRVTSLTAVLAFTFLNSICAGLVTSGLFFAARAGYGFGPAANYGLGVVIGATYTVGALLASRIVARSRGRARAVALRILGVLACATMLPMLFPGQPFAIWLVALIYAPVVANLWPIVQSYVSGGRAGAPLRNAVGQFNLTWGTALVLGFGLCGPFLESAPTVVLAALGGVHLVSASILLRFAPSPAQVAEVVGVDVADARDLALRRVFQGLLPLTNVLGFALAPFLPELFAKLGLPGVARASFAVVWLLPRAIAFGVLGRWHGWHGRFGTAVAGTSLLISGFALALLAPWVSTGTTGLALEVVGLIAFGVGMATVYTAAFYYAQAVGRAAVGAGGRHEALLGLGATIGPSLGLVAALAVDNGVLPASAFEPTLVAACVVVAVVLSLRALRS